MNLFSFRRHYHLRRYRDIAEVLIKHGFGMLIDQMDLWPMVSLRRRFMKQKDVPGSRGERLRAALAELGPTFVKLGQLLSTRHDLLPQDITSELERLQDDVPPVEFEKIKALIEDDFGRPLDSLYASFDPQPIAAASVGQVHRARLFDGSEVAVKVIRPRIRTVINADLDILYRIAKMVKDRIQDSVIDPIEILDEFARSIRYELDVSIEASNMQKFKKNFENNEEVHIPRVFKKLCSKKVLTIEYIAGIKINNFAKLDEIGVDRKVVAANGARALMQMVIMDGFFHADPHPGNILVDSNGKITFLDFGLVGRITEETLTWLAELFLGIINKDPGRMVRSLVHIGKVEGKLNKNKLRLDLMELVDHNYGESLHRINLGEIVITSLRITRRHGLKMPADFFLLAKAILTIESIAKKLDPEFNIIDTAQPFAKRLLLRRYDPERLLQRTREEVSKQVEYLFDFPEQVNTFLDNANTGKFEVGFRHRGLEQLVNKLDIVTNRLAVAMILAALLVSSSMIIRLEAGPKFIGYPLLGILGYAFSGVIGLWLIVSILRSGRL